jgi:hypothetical protein
MRRRGGVQDHGPPAEGRHLEPDPLQRFAVRLDGIQLLVGEVERDRQEQELRRRAARLELLHHAP